MKNPMFRNVDKGGFLGLDVFDYYIMAIAFVISASIMMWIVDSNPEITMLTTAGSVLLTGIILVISKLGKHKGFITTYLLYIFTHKNYTPFKKPYNDLSPYLKDKDL